MSCFVVNDYHVNALVAWGLCHGAIVGISPDALAGMLAGANRAAFTERYEGRHADEVSPYAGFDRAVNPTHLVPVAIVKACDCLDYQASDWPTWRESEPAAHLAVIRAAALALATGGRYLGADAPAYHLPGYEAAAWTLDEPDTWAPETQAPGQAAAYLAAGHALSACDSCADLVPAIVGAPDGREVCRACFEQGAA